MNAMKNILLFGFFFCTLAGCKKIIESTQENLVVKAMTDGQWKVTRFKRDTADVTANFAPYLFQFRTDNTVEALNNNAVESKGSWAADAAARTIVSSFNNNAALTLQLLNGTWTITNNSWTFVEAIQTVNGEVRTLRLDK
ncbi:hypothetical protein GCM10023229_01000 [Flavisolibacter ginsenosidimutans]